MPTSTLMFLRTVRQARRHTGVALGQAIVPALLIGTIFTALFGSVSRLPGFPDASYDDWVLPGTLFLSAVVGAGFTAAELLRDINTGFIDRIRLTPASTSSLVAGRVGFEAVRGMVAASVILAIGLGRGLSNDNGAGGIALVLVLTAGFATAWNGIFYLTAVVTKKPAAVLGLQPLFFPIMLFSTWFGPRTLMPNWFSQVARFNPVTVFLDACRSILSGRTDWTLVALTALFEIALATVTYGLSARAFRRLGTD